MWLSLFLYIFELKLLLILIHFYCQLERTKSCLKGSQLRNHTDQIRLWPCLWRIIWISIALVGLSQCGCCYSWASWTWQKGFLSRSHSTQVRKQSSNRLSVSCPVLTSLNEELWAGSINQINLSSPNFFHQGVDDSNNTQTKRVSPTHSKEYLIIFSSWAKPDKSFGNSFTYTPSVYILMHIRQSR